uniref:acyl carrier protein n=1 Tax=Polynucleobacter sp. TaxID=2029855 RepID=UPI004048E845
MTNNEKYVDAFIKAFLVEESELTNLKYQSIATWDSVGHMGLIAALEEAFDVELDIDDIIDFSSFDTGKEILKKYNILIK